MSTFSQSFGEAFGQTVGTLVVYVLLILFALLAATVIFGGVFLALAIVFYKKKKRKTFLVFGILSDVFLSLLASLLANGVFHGNGGTIVLAWALFFIAGFVLVIRYYKK